MKAYSSHRFDLPLPAGHRFPMRKYSRLQERVASELEQVQVLEPGIASDGQLALAHHPSYIQRFCAGELSPAEQRRIGFPWSTAMVERARRSAGATIDAVRTAAREGVAFNLAGGTHHAGRAHGEGFCCFNDVAVAACLAQAERLARRVAIIDLDVHQGNGPAEILARDDSVFTLSLHGARNYPFTKAISRLDVELPDGCADEAYLEALESALARMRAVFQPDFLIYLAGADVYEGDRLSRLALSKAGIRVRDQRVFALAGELGVPVAVCMGGGYSPVIEDIVDIHMATVVAGLRHWQALSGSV